MPMFPPPKFDVWMRFGKWVKWQRNNYLQKSR